MHGLGFPWATNLYLPSEALPLVEHGVNVQDKESAGFEVVIRGPELLRVQSDSILNAPLLGYCAWAARTDQDAWLGSHHAGKMAYGVYRVRY